MLRWRLVVGTLTVVVLIGAAWLDHLAEIRYPAVPKGVCLLPVAIFFAAAATGEMLGLVQAAGAMRPAPWGVYAGSLLVVLSGWLPEMLDGGAAAALGLPPAAWPPLALVAGMGLVVACEMRRYEPKPGECGDRRPGGVMANLAAAALTLVYVGLMLSFAVQLRIGWGVAALGSLVIVAKVADIGAYCVGRVVGRHPMAPRLSPRKTIEGAIGGGIFACLASWLTFGGLVPLLAPSASRTEPWRWILFALAVGSAGMLGDLAESLLKRGAGRKDSSRWVPGLGGVLDQLDSVLAGAPVAWLCWASGLVGGSAGLLE